MDEILKATPYIPYAFLGLLFLYIKDCSKSLSGLRTSLWMLPHIKEEELAAAVEKILRENKVPNLKMPKSEES